MRTRTHLAARLLAAGALAVSASTIAAPRDLLAQSAAPAARPATAVDDRAAVRQAVLD